MRIRISTQILILTFFALSLSAQSDADSKNENFVMRNLNHRIYLGEYNSYFDNIRVMQAGYDCVLQLIRITPDFNLFDFGLGADALIAFDNHGYPANDRPVNARITPGCELNWTLRMYLIPIPKIKARIFLEGMGMTLVVYNRQYPDNGTNLNIGSHAGFGFEYPVSNFKCYSSLRLFHSSNGKEYAKNPALNSIGIIMGIQFR